MNAEIAAYLRRRRAASKPSDLLFHSLRGYAGVDLLPRALTIAGVTVSPSLWILGGAATATELTPEVGAVMPISGSGPLPTLNTGSPLGHQGAGDLSGLDDSVTGTGGKNYETATGVSISTLDTVCEAIVRPVTSGIKYLVTGYAGGGGWRFYVLGDGVVFYLRDAGAAVATGVSAAAAGYAFSHIMFFIDRSGFGQAYLNGIPSGPPVDVTGVVDAESAAGVSVCSDIGGATPSVDVLAQFALWKRAAWLDTHLQAAVAATRFRRLRGLIAQYARGDDEPTVDSRTTAAYVMRREVGGTYRVYFVGGGWACPHEHPPGQTRAMIRREPEVAALRAQSEALDTHLLFPAGGTTVSANAVVAPNGETTADRLVEAAITATHMRFAFAFAGGIGDVALRSVYFKAGDRRYAVVGIYEAGAAHASYIIIDTTDGAITATGAIGDGTRIGPILESHVDVLGGGWYRAHVSCYGVIAINLSGLTGIASDAATVSFLGDPATYPLGIAFWGSMVTDVTTSGLRRHGSYIPTATATVTKTADSLRYEGLQNLGFDGNARKGRLSCDIWLPNAPLGTDRFAFSANDGGTVADRIEARVRASDGKAALQIQSTEGGLEVDIAGTTPLNDGAIHRVEVRYAAGGVSLLVDGVVEATAAPTWIPAGLGRIQLGSDYAENGGAIHFANLEAAKR